MDQGEQRLIEVFEKSRKKFEYIAHKTMKDSNREDAEDVVQNAFTSAWKRRECITDIENVDLWIQAFVVNYARLSMKKWMRYNRIHTEMTPEVEDKVVYYSIVPAAILWEDELKWVRNEVTKLPMYLQETQAMKNEGICNVEIGNNLGLSRKGVDNRLWKIKCILKQAWKEAGYGDGKSKASVDKAKEV